MYRLLLALALAAALLAPTPAAAQLLDTQLISLEAAKRMTAAAEAEARRNGWNVAIAVVDAAGELILFQRLDGVQPASLDIAVAKARTAARLRRPTRALQDALEGGRTALLALEGVLPLEGGIPVAVDGRVIGAIGVSGVTSQQDAQIAQAGLDALRR